MADDGTPSGFADLQKGLRSFRLDRVKSVALQPRQFVRPAQFDVQGHLASSIAILPRKFSIEVQLETDLGVAARTVSSDLCFGARHRDAVLLRSQADDLNWFARELARLPWPVPKLSSLPN